MKYKRSAFTLVELLMATMLTTMVISGAFMSLSVVLKAYKNSSAQSNFAEISRLILQRMRTDIEGAFLSPHKDSTRFVGTDDPTSQFPTDTLTFISTVNNTQLTGEGTSDLVEIQYYIDNDPATVERWLLRRSDATPDIDPFSGGDIQLLGPQVVTLDFQYFDGESWWPEWDSEESIPLAIEIKIGFFEPKATGEVPSEENIRIFSSTANLMHYRKPSESEETGTTSSGGQGTPSEGSFNPGGGSSPNQGGPSPGGSSLPQGGR